MAQQIPVQLDVFDHKILIELERDGVLTAAALAERVGLSPSACHRRVKAMEAAGVIEGYAAILSEKALGRSATVFVAVTLEDQRRETMAKFERAVALCRELGEENLAHAEGHRDIVKRFGRFPHRNPILGRETTEDERRFLDAGGFAG